MATLDFGERDLYADCTEDFPWTATLYERDGITQKGLDLADVVHCVLSTRDGDEPNGEVLAIDSDTATANDSIVEIDDQGGAAEDASGSVRFAQADTAAIVTAWDAEATPPQSRRYVCELFYIDSGEANPVNAKKIILRGTIHLHRTAAIS
jgi:hypothetical protein